MGAAGAAVSTATITSTWIGCAKPFHRQSCCPSSMERLKELYAAGIDVSSRSRIPSSALSCVWRYTFASIETSGSESTRFQYSSDQSLLVYFDEQVERKKTGGAKAPPLHSRITLRA